MTQSNRENAEASSFATTILIFGSLDTKPK
jgi:hypothetical protein